MFAYPVQPFPHYMNDSMIFGYLLYLVISVYVLRNIASFGLGSAPSILSTMTAMEILFERCADLIEYYTWKWEYPFG
jgi:hypothetical protein